MKITPSSALQQAEQASRIREGVARATPAAGSPVQPTGATPRVDRVEISDAGRALSAQSASEAPTAPAGDELSAERLTELRQRVLGGAYNSLEVVDQIARRMLQRGDL
ncbi:MAG TPA: flagellar biosynthesis anti-sigma factor FlgM [Gemmatimonadaceae bacterium]|nr:flagellar biosynthesis anti-sigma factor FlgM [Gemmatimonadaceae bacterium]